MKELNEKQIKLANKAINALAKLQNDGVVPMVIDGGGGRNGLTFWIPENDEDDNALDLIHTEEFQEKSHHPTKSIGLRIDVLVP